MGDLELNIRSKGNTSYHVVKSQRRDVTTLQRHDAWSTEESKQVTQRRDVTTSRRCCASIIKSKGRPNFKGIEERADLRVKNRAAVTRIIGEDSSFCISSFRINYG